MFALFLQSSRTSTTKAPLMNYTQQFGYQSLWSERHLLPGPGNSQPGFRLWETSSRTSHGITFPWNVPILLGQDAATDHVFPCFWKRHSFCSSQEDVPGIAAALFLTTTKKTNENHGALCEALCENMLPHKIHLKPHFDAFCPILDGHNCCSPPFFGETRWREVVRTKQWKISRELVQQKLNS